MPNENDLYLKCGWANPYHFETPKSPAEFAACAVISNLNDRAGFNFSDIDSDVRVEMVKDLTYTIQACYDRFEEFNNGK